jgi:hypothetical protein
MDLLGADFLKAILSNHSFFSFLNYPISGSASLRSLSCRLLIFHLRAVWFLVMGCVEADYRMALSGCSGFVISVFFSSLGYLLVLFLDWDGKGLLSSLGGRGLFFYELKCRRILWSCLLLEGLGFWEGVCCYGEAFMLTNR